ncbi:MAG: mechanosensitive ion channel [Alphaproteobacteria bacterium]|nr:mechanosensitive ion channel [Alphaproteobacteria bacterium]
MAITAPGVLSRPLADIGGTPITVAGLMLALAIVVISFTLSRIAVRLIARLRNRRNHGGAALYILEKLAGYGIAIVGVLFAFSTMGLNLSSLAVFAGAVGVGIGLGLQGVVKEFVSGIVLLFGRELRVGDFVELPTTPAVRGLVWEIGARATRVRTSDSLDVFVPNSRFIEERFTNWTLKGDTRRIHVAFNVASDADKAKVRDVVIAAAKELPFTLPDEGARRTQVWMTSFGDSGLNFELVVWPTLDAVKRPAAMQAAYMWAIDDALRAARIEVPFPQRELRIRSIFGREGDAALAALGHDTVPRKSPPSEPECTPSRNDAAHETVRPEELPPGRSGTGLRSERVGFSE